MTATNPETMGDASSHAMETEVPRARHWYENVNWLNMFV